MGVDMDFEYVPSFQVPKAKFVSVKVESSVFVIGGHDDLKSCSQYDLNANKLRSLNSTIDSW